MAKRKTKCGVYNMGWRSFEDSINTGIAAEKAGHRVQFFTDQMVAYFFREQSVPVFGEEPMVPGPLKYKGEYIPTLGCMGLPKGIMGIPNPNIVMPVIAEKTTDIEFYLGAIDCVRNGPSVLAQTFMTLDHAAQGRAFFALGGSEMKQISPYGYSRIGSAKKLEESLIIIRKLFESDGEPVFFEGEYYSMTGGSLPMEPYRKGKPPRVVVAPGISNEIMGQYSDGMLTNTKRHPGGYEAFKKDVQSMRDAANRAGRDGDKLIVTACPQLLMHDDPKVLRRLASHPKLTMQTMLTGREKGIMWREDGFVHPLGDEFGYARKLRPEKMDVDVLKKAVTEVPPEAVMKIGFHAGSVEEVAAQLKPFCDGGLEYLGLVDYATWADQSDEMAEEA
ncbi:MAG: LLM class flavin-dependent oxidoreductase, partial [Spongiibacteraceae bacterium]